MARVEISVTDIISVSQYIKDHYPPGSYLDPVTLAQETGVGVDGVIELLENRGLAILASGQDAGGQTVRIYKAPGNRLYENPAGLDEYRGGEPSADDLTQLVKQNAPKGRHQPKDDPVYRW